MKPDQRKFVLLSYLEGLFYALMVATSESFALFFSVKQGLEGSSLAILSTFPLFLGALAQWFIPGRVKENHLKKGIVTFMAVQLTGLLVLCYSSSAGFSFHNLLAALTLYWVGGLTIGPLWLDWMSSHFPRGSFRIFLGRRNAFVILMTLTFYLGMAHLFQHQKFLSQTTIFVVGCLARILSIGCQVALSFLVKKEAAFMAGGKDQAESRSESESGPENRPGPADTFNLDFLKKILWISFLWTGLFKLAVNLSSPFFLPYMVKELRLSLWDYTLLTSIPMLGRSLFLSGWGRASEGYLPFLGLQISCTVISLIPALWTLSPEYSYLIGLEFCSGIFWGGFDLSAVLIIQNFVEKGSARIHGLHMAIMNSFAVVGSLLGALLLKMHLSYETIFYISSTFRLFISIMFVVQISRYPIIRFRVKTCRAFLFTVLSLRPSLANIGRILFPSLKPIVRKVPSAPPSSLHQPQNKRQD